MRYVLIAALIAAPALGRAQEDLDASNAPKAASGKRVSAALSGSVRVVDSAGKPVEADAVVYLLGPTDAEPLPPRAATIRQTDDLRFVPDLVVIAAGDAVEFPNDAKFLHNVFSRRPLFDLGTYGAGESKSRTYAERGVYDVYCNLHPAMAATIVVVPNHFFARAKDGAFRIEGVPIGDWTVYAYARRAGKPVSRKIQVPPKGASVELELTVGPPVRRLQKP